MPLCHSVLIDYHELSNTYVCFLGGVQRSVHFDDAYLTRYPFPGHQLYPLFWTFLYPSLFSLWSPHLNTVIDTVDCEFDNIWTHLEEKLWYILWEMIQSEMGRFTLKSGHCPFLDLAPGLHTKETASWALACIPLCSLTGGRVSICPELLLLNFPTMMECILDLCNTNSTLLKLCWLGNFIIYTGKGTATTVPQLLLLFFPLGIGPRFTLWGKFPGLFCVDDKKRLHYSVTLGSPLSLSSCESGNKLKWITNQQNP